VELNSTHPHAQILAPISSGRNGVVSHCTLKGGVLASRRASTPAYFNTGVAARRVSVRALPDLWDGCRWSAEQGRAVAAALHVAGRALCSFHRRYGRRRGWHHYGKHSNDGDDAGHNLLSVPRFTRRPAAPQTHHLATAITHPIGTLTGPK
jgi:hypothetical protein